jgi:hypothetical protein
VGLGTSISSSNLRHTAISRDLSRLVAATG